ncbi:hypothetical protein GQ44DRAFT_824302 [Phaeosphaeriaceae sp. PMI808]|nr:hypothetical protein GQ44DRAFT_824302 [Phaeosphaeriaceae sp. PMI808]
MTPPFLSPASAASHQRPFLSLPTIILTRTIDSSETGEEHDDNTLDLYNEVIYTPIGVPEMHWGDPIIERSPTPKLVDNSDLKLQSTRAAGNYHEKISWLDSDSYKNYELHLSGTERAPKHVGHSLTRTPVLSSSLKHLQVNTQQASKTSDGDKIQKSAPTDLDGDNYTPTSVEARNCFLRRQVTPCAFLPGIEHLTDIEICITSIIDVLRNDRNHKVQSPRNPVGNVMHDDDYLDEESPRTGAFFDGACSRYNGYTALDEVLGHCSESFEFARARSNVKGSIPDFSVASPFNTSNVDNAARQSAINTSDDIIPFIHHSDKFSSEDDMDGVDEVTEIMNVSPRDITEQNQFSDFDFDFAVAPYDSVLHEIHPSLPSRFIFDLWSYTHRPSRRRRVISQFDTVSENTFGQEKEYPSSSRTDYLKEFTADQRGFVKLVSLRRVEFLDEEFSDEE